MLTLKYSRIATEDQQLANRYINIVRSHSLNLFQLKMQSGPLATCLTRCLDAAARRIEVASICTLYKNPASLRINILPLIIKSIQLVKNLAMSKGTSKITFQMIIHCALNISISSTSIKTSSYCKKISRDSNN